jgi:hypothetical protein
MVAGDSAIFFLRVRRHIVKINFVKKNFDDEEGFEDEKQGCQMIYFQTKDINLGKFCNVF